MTRAAPSLSAAGADAIFAVLTGDLVRSQAIDAARLEIVRQSLAEAAEALNRARPGLVVGPPQFFRGDAWQLVLSEPGAFLRAAVYLRARLLTLETPVDTRVAVGLGAVERLEPQAVSQSVGEAFTLSGHTLDRMRRRLEIRAGLPPSAAVPWLPAVLALTSTLVARWKPKQAEAVRHALEADAATQGEIARQVRVTRQTVNRALTTAGWPAVLEAIELVEATDWAAATRVGDPSQPKNAASFTAN